ncbi:hypothetical protein IFM89_017284, partial [Coptis chinensis]
MVPVAYAVLDARAILFQGVSTLLKYIPVKACKGQIPHAHSNKETPALCFDMNTESSFSNVLGATTKCIQPQSSSQSIEFPMGFEAEQSTILNKDEGGNFLEGLCKCENAEDVGKWVNMSVIPIADRLGCTFKMGRDSVSNILNELGFCPQVFIGEKGHLIESCYGFRRRAKNQVHEWIDGSLNDILVPVEAFHLHNIFQDLIKHDQRFDFDRIPAALELCCQAGANIYEENLHSCNWASDTNENGVAADSRTQQELQSVAIETLEAWENLRSGVQRLLLVYPAKVCKHCSEVHVGPSGHKARLCGVFKHESWRGSHMWKKAEVDDFIPPKVVWRRRPQDPLVLCNEGRDFYGHAPAVVELCFQAGAVVHNKYHCMMKVNGLPPTSSSFM